MSERGGEPTSPGSSRAQTSPQSGARPPQHDTNAFGKKIDRRNKFEAKSDNRNREIKGAPVTMTQALVEEVTGWKAFEAVKRLEIVFTQVNTIGNLEAFRSLKELDMVETGVQAISGLEPVRNTLTRLNLTGNNIQVIENLGLPHLRELCLGDNNIARISGLDSCLRLQKLWLYSNRLARIENLSHLADLRELWLQDNNITRTEGLGALVNLTGLNLADNEIADLKEMQALIELPMLKTLAFDDPNFGPCPLAGLDGYRSYVMLNLKQVRILDGESIHEKERDIVEDQYIKSVLDFNDRVDVLKRTNKEDLDDIERRRDKNLETAKQMKRQLVEAFRRLEKLCDDGRNKIVEEITKQRLLYDTNRAELAARLEDQRAAYATEVQRLVTEYDRMIESEEAKHRISIAETDQIAADIERLTELQYTTSGTVVGMELDREAPEYKFAEHCLTKAAAIHGSASVPIVPTRIVRLFNLGSEVRFKGYTDSINESVRNTQRMFYHPADASDLWQVIEHGFHGAADQLVPLSMEPKANKKKKKSSEIVLVCRVELGKLYESRDGALLQGTVADLDTLTNGEIHTVKLVVPAAEGGEEGGGSTVYLVRPSQVVPEFYVRYRYSMDKGVNTPYDDIDEAYLLKRFNYGMESLKKIERGCEDEFRRYRHRVWMELDVESAKKIEEQSEEVRRLLDTVDTLKEQIGAERRQQESTMKDMKAMQHNAIGRKAGPKEKTVAPFGANMSTKQMMQLISNARDSF